MPRKREDRRARLVWIIDGMFDVEAQGPNASAAENTVRELAEHGRLEPIDEALVVTFLTLAAAIDGDPTNAALWGQYRAAETTLRALGADAGGDDLAKFLGSLGKSVSSSSRDPEIDQP